MAFPHIPVVKCCNCGFMWSSKVLPAQRLTSYYEFEFGSERHRHGQVVNSKVNCWITSKLLDLRRVNDVLDVGAGYGYFIQRLSDIYNLRTTGVELSQQESLHATQVLLQNVLNAPLGTSGLKKEQFDLVTSFEVLEHVAQPLDFLHEISQYVKPNGYLLIMTDNFDSRMARSLGPAFPKWIPHSHISHFSPSTLRTGLSHLGNFTITKVVSFTPWEVELRNAYYALRGIRKTPDQAFDLRRELSNEMSGRYKLPALRKLLNQAWARLALSEGANEDLMYFLLRKRDASGTNNSK